ncbi:MAG: hypothetical protein GY702_01490 [Desulfobulbaceae bacterium]|nr:hypothetical protein [Desulfobulbaceae bacterium]
MSAKNLGSRMLIARLDRQFGTSTTPEEVPTRALPNYVNFQLARLRLLHDIPFRYLVPDARLLPDESARLFTLDDEWLSAVVVGALSAAGNGSRELTRARAAVGEAELRSTQLRYAVRKVALRRAEFELAADSDHDVNPGTVSGLLLRSKLVSQWPRLALRAWTSADRRRIPDGADPDRIEQNRPELVVPILRMEHLSPGVLLALFDGIPEMFWLEEPHGAVQYGVSETSGGGYEVELRDADAQETSTTVPVGFRPGAVADGVVSITSLANAIDQAQPLGTARGSAGLAAQLLRPPIRQRYES